MRGLAANPRKGGTYYIDRIYKGNRLYKSCRTKNQREAEKEAKELYKLFVQEIDRPKITPTAENEVKMLSELLDEFNIIKWKTNDNGEQSYKQAKYAVEVMGDIPVADINNQWIIKYRVKLSTNAEKVIKPPTVNRYLTALRAATSYAVKIGYTDKALYYPMTAEEGRMRIITRNEMNLMCDKMSARKDIAGGMIGVVLMHFLAEVGCRCGEACSLTWDRVNMDTRYATFTLTKNNAARTIPLTQAIWELLDNFFPEEQRVGRLFPFIPANYNDAWDECKCQIQEVAADVEFVPHSLRHTCASRLAALGVSLQEIGSWLGHKTLATTMKYAHLVNGHLEQARKALDDEQRNLATNAVKSRRNRELGNVEGTVKTETRVIRQGL